MSNLREAAFAALQMLERALCSTGYCCCGSEMESHGIYDGHGPVDEGDYHQEKAIANLKAALAEPPPKPRREFLALAEQCGATLTGKPDGSEAITVVFSIEAWRKFDAATTRKPMTHAQIDVLCPGIRVDGHTQQEIARAVEHFHEIVSKE